MNQPIDFFLFLKLKIICFVMQRAFHMWRRKCYFVTFKFEKKGHNKSQFFKQLPLPISSKIYKVVHVLLHKQHRNPIYFLKNWLCLFQTTLPNTSLHATGWYKLNVYMQLIISLSFFIIIVQKILFYVKTVNIKWINSVFV